MNYIGQDPAQGLHTRAASGFPARSHPHHIHNP
nr:MAG TPA: hypothetical protein [Caudoviricetes sp.]